MEAPILQLSSSEELDGVSIDAESEDSPPQSHAFEELLVVITRAVERLSIEWPEDRQGARSKSKLDERFLPSRAQPQRRSLPFFPDLHTEVSRSWGKQVSYRVYTAQTSHYSSIYNYKEHGYGEMPKVEETLASSLSPATASSLKAPALPSKPVKFTSSLVHKAYAAAGQAAACSHTMSLMQAYQAELLGDSEEGGGISADTVSELRRATDLPLRATKETAKSIGRSMAALVATERHLWLDLSDIKDKEKYVILDAPVSTQGLFGDAVNSAVAKSQEASKQAAALQKLLPRRSSLRLLSGSSLTHLKRALSTVPLRNRAFPPVLPHKNLGDTEGALKPSSLRGVKRICGPLLPPRRLLGKSPDVRGLRTNEGSPPRSRAVNTSFHGARLSSVPSGDRSANPAASGVTGRSGLRRAHISRSTRKRSGLGMPAPSEEGARAVCSVVPCRCAVTGRRTDYSTATKSRNQSREAGTSSRIFDSVEATVKCFSLGPADRGKRVSDTILETPTSVYGGPAHSGGPRAGSGYGTGSKLSVRERGHRICTSLQQGNRVLQPVLHSSKEGRGIASHFRSSSSERVIHSAQVQNVNIETNRATDQVRGLVCHDRPQGRIFPYFHPSVSLEVPEVCFRGQSIPISSSSIRPGFITPHFHQMRGCSPGALAPSGFSHIELDRRLVVFSSVASGGDSASRCRPRPYERAGVTAERQEECAFSTSEDHFFRRGLGFSVDAGAPVTATCRLHPCNCEKCKARPATHCQTVPETVGSHGSSFQRDTFWTTAHETPAVVAQDQRVFPEGQPISHNQGHAAMPTCLGYVEETLVPVPGPSAGSSLSSQTANDGCFPHGLGSDPRGSLISRSVGRPSSFLAYQSPRDVSCLPGSEELYHRSQGRHSVETGAEARGREAPPRGGGADMEGVWPSTSGSVCVSRDVSLSTLVLPHASSSSGTGCYGTDVAEATSVRLSPSCSAPGSSGESSQGPGLPASYSPVLAGQSMVSRSCVPPRRASSGASCQEGPSVPSRGLDFSPPTGTVEPVGLASEGAQLIESGLSTEVVETILQSRAPSTRKLYALKWRVFTSWCSDRRLDPVNCPIGTVLEFLQDRFTAGLTPSTLKVYVAAIGAYHIPLGGMSVGKDPLASRFLRGTWRLRPAVRSRVPPWDLSIALQGLSLAPFEPIEEVPEKFLTLKALFFLAISSLKRIGDLQALSVAPSCLEFAPGMVKAFLHPRPGYRPIVLQAFCPPPFQNADQEANNLLCPVRALDAYVHRAALWRKSDQLFVCFGSPNKGGPVSKQRMSKWVVEAISLAYEAAGQPSPLAVRSHSTRSMAASKALISGVSLQDVCDAAGWSSPHTFVRFYSLDLDSTPGSQVLSS
ncbi:hypothetical protein PO909_025279 [Leuciscus waleckii]